MNINTNYPEGGLKSNMTMRDWFAGIMMQSIAKEIITEAAFTQKCPVETLRKASTLSWSLADMMIETKNPK